MAARPQRSTLLALGHGSARDRHRALPTLRVVPSSIPAAGALDGGTTSLRRAPDLAQNVTEPSDTSVRDGACVCFALYSLSLLLLSATAPASQRASVEGSDGGRYAGLAGGCRGLHREVDDRPSGCDGERAPSAAERADGRGRDDRAVKHNLGACGEPYGHVDTHPSPRRRRRTNRPLSRPPSACDAADP